MARYIKSQKSLKKLNKHQNQSQDMAEVLELSDQEFLKSMINMFRASMEKVDNM